MSGIKDAPFFQIECDVETVVFFKFYKFLFSNYFIQVKYREYLIKQAEYSTTNDEENE